MRSSQAPIEETSSSAIQPGTESSLHAPAVIPLDSLSNPTSPAAALLVPQRPLPLSNSSKTRSSTQLELNASNQSHGNHAQTSSDAEINKTPKNESITSTPIKRRTTTRSQYFNKPTPQKSPRPPAGTVSCIEVPPLWDPTFGLVQEEFAHNPFNLLVAVIFLNKTKGKHAIPIFRQVIEMFPTAAQLAEADAPTLSFVINALGLQNQRAHALIKLAKAWMSDPPKKGRRYRTLNYPHQGAAQGIKVGDILSDDDPRLGAWEIGHLPGLGPYAFDSWRIFCRDRLRGVADDWNSGGAGPMFEPEWKRVLPQDKELRAILRWLWLKEGWVWDPITGEKEVASGELMRRAEKGGLVWDADTDFQTGRKPALPTKPNDLGIVQSFPKEDMRVLVRSSRNGGVRFNQQELGREQAPSEDSEDVEAERNPDPNGDSSSSDSSGSDPSNLSDSSDPSDSSEEESEKSQNPERSEHGKVQNPDLEVVASEYTTSESEGSEDADSDDESSKMEASIVKRRRADAAGSSSANQEQRPTLLIKDSQGMYQCTKPSCNKTFVNAKGRRRHIASVHERQKFICTLCNASLSRADKLTNHLKTKHSDHNKLKCTMCAESFWTSDLLNRHVRTVHDRSQSFVCTACDMELSRKDKFINHLRTKRHLANVDESKRRRSDNEPLRENYDDNDEVSEQDEDVEMESADEDEAAGEQPDVTKADSGFKCTICDVELSRRDKLENHYRTARHAKSVAEQEHKRREQKKRKADVLYDEEVFEKDAEMESTTEESEEEEE
jgi:methyl-CpG-binding domain protein 4